MWGPSSPLFSGYAGSKLPWLQANQSPQPSTEVRKEWSNNSTSPLYLHGASKENFFFLRRYNFGEVLAFSTNSFHLDRFLMQSFQVVILRFATSLFTLSSHLFLGHPSDLVNAGDHSYTLSTMLSSGIRCTCPNQANLIGFL